MGVRGLTTYVQGHRHFFRDVKFRDSRLVIDGSSLFFCLYFTQGLDQQRGGEYEGFASLLTTFLSALAACNIQPYVVLDGGVDPSDKKFTTLRQRLQSAIIEADKISRGKNGSVLPILARDVFIQVLLQKGVPLVQCPAEADWEIACLAHQWNCPVLTNDSDFYIFDLPGGYLPLNFFSWTNLNGGASQQYISTRCYTTTSLCRYFGGLNCDLLPLGAVLLGNDYGTPRDTETLLSLLDMRRLGRGGGRAKSRAPAFRIEGLLHWLSTFSSSAEALAEVSRLMGEGSRSKKGQLSSQLWASMQEYHISPQSSLALWFSGGKDIPRDTFLLQHLPKYLSLAAAQGLVAPLVLDVLVMRRVSLIPQVENSRLPSSHCSAKAIRQVIYGLLLQKGSANMFEVGGGKSRNAVQQSKRLGGGERGCVGILSPHQHLDVGFGSEQAAAVQMPGPSCPLRVEELDRRDLNLMRNQVEPHLSCPHLCLDTLEQAPMAVRLGVLSGVLGVKESAVSTVPPHWRLAVMVTTFWLREARPKPSEHQVQALVLGMVYGELSWTNQHGATPHSHFEQQTLVGLDRFRVRAGERRGLDLMAAHSFSQWQACFWSGLCLNQLLLRPAPEPHLPYTFSGTLVHGLLKCLKAGQAAESMLSGGDTFSKHLYSVLLDTVKSCSSRPWGPSSAEGKRRGKGQRRGRGRTRGGEERGTEEVNNKFALLMSEGEAN